MGFILNLLISATLMVISYMLTPKQKVERPTIQEGAEPTADAGKPIAVLFGTKDIKSPNCIWFGDKYYRERMVDA